MEREQEDALLDGLEAELHDRGKAVAGFGPVVDAINQGRVWKLFYGKTLKLKGGECADCGSYAPETKGPCPYCGGKLKRVAQTLDRLSQSVFDMAGQVEVVDGPAAKRLAKHGSIAALLRY
jgi:hypothetical protein